MSREQWLMDGMAALAELVRRQGRQFPANVRVSVGFPRGSKTAIGQAHYAQNCAQGRFQNLFISPTLDHPVEVLGVLLHEMVHAVVGPEAGHGGEFRALATALGLGSGEAGPDGEPTERRMTCANAVPGTRLWNELEQVADMLGHYPHAAMVGNTRRGKRNLPEKHISYHSPQEPEYKVLVSFDNLENYGVPRDPWGNEMVLKAELG